MHLFQTKLNIATEHFEVLEFIQKSLCYNDMYISREGSKQPSKTYVTH